MIEINQELFIVILFVAFFIGAILKIIVGIVCRGEPKEFGLWDAGDGIIWVVLLLIVLLS